MPASDRLAELRRQRALIQAHLAWLDQEIAALEKPAAGPASPAKPPADAAVNTTPVPEISSPASGAGRGETDAQADAILSEYRAASSDLQRDVRKGCLLYFVGAFAVLALAVAILWFALRR